MMTRSKLLNLFVTWRLATAKKFSFLGLGDWGGAAIGGQIEDNVYAVSQQMEKTAAQYDAHFIVNTGDNFYYCGVQNTSDYQLNVDYVQPYNSSTLGKLDWYSVLGNHEYGYNVSAQISYSQVNKRWILDDRYYTRRIFINGSDASTFVTFIFIDSSPCVSSYRSGDTSGWDPCSSEYPTCSLKDTDDDFEGPCMFHENIKSQSCGEQFAWFQKVLNNVPSTDWLIVVGHHPIDELDVKDFSSVLQTHGFSLYMNGHVHTLAQYTINYTGAYVTTGAGSMVDTADQRMQKTKVKLQGANFDIRAVDGSSFTPADQDQDQDLIDLVHAAKEASRGVQGLQEAQEAKPAVGSSSTGRAAGGSTTSYQTVFNEAVAGFTLHTFNSDFSKLTTNYISYTGETVHSFVVNRLGTVIS